MRRKPHEAGSKGVLARISTELKAAVPYARSVVLFGSATEGGAPGDIDLAMIVPDECDLFEVARAIAPIVAERTAIEGILVSCFPISETRFRSGGSQFARNVRDHGQEI
jgi:predicted nucleotidyltransferase